MRKVFICIMMFLPFNALAENVTKFAAQIEALEQKEGGHIGVAAVNLVDDERLEYRANERFAMCSTFKLPLVAAVLSRVDEGKDKLDRLVEFSQADIQEYAPVTKQHLKKGKMSIAELSAAAIQYSDNTAANLLLQSIGGPKAFTRYVRSVGDKITRLDRNEPTLNSNLPNDPRDTTTPSAMVDTMRKLLVDNALSLQSREQLNIWLVENTTGDKKLRAGINPAWKIGDKTGSGENGASNDVAIVWPTDKKPFLVAVYYTGADTSADKKGEVIAEIGRIVSATFYPEQ
jgi:beta-lactamase class A